MKRRVKLNAWELAALEMAVRYRLPYMEASSGKILLAKLERASAITVTVEDAEQDRPTAHPV